MSLVVIEHVGSAHDVMKRGIRGGNARAERKMVDQLVLKKNSGVNSFIFSSYSVCSLRSTGWIAQS